MTHGAPPRTSQLMRIVDLEHGAVAHDKRMSTLEEAHEEFGTKLDSVLEVVLQLKTVLWLFGKIGGGLVGVAIIAGAVVGVLHAVGH